MNNLKNLAEFPLLQIWGDTVHARRVEGERITLAIVELAPNAVVPEHRHANEQLGMVITGQIRFTIDGETKDLGRGGTWRIIGNVPHDVVAGPDGAVVIDVFTPIRDDWNDRAIAPGDPSPRWPER